MNDHPIGQQPRSMLQDRIATLMYDFDGRLEQLENQVKKYRDNEPTPKQDDIKRQHQLMEAPVTFFSVWVSLPSFLEEMIGRINIVQQRLRGIIEEGAE